MSGSKEWTEWHLTSRGWERGSEKIDFCGIKEKLPPKDRVVTKKFHENISSHFSSLEYNVEEIWSCGNKSKIDELIKKFGNCPKSL